MTKGQLNRLYEKKKFNILLLDIEGTILPISFVKDILFPYVVENLEGFLNQYINWENLFEEINSKKSTEISTFQEKVTHAVVELIKQSERDAIDPPKNYDPSSRVIINSAVDQLRQSLIKNIKWQISIDRKHWALKGFQGLVWKNGFESGEVVAPIYEDVSSFLRDFKGKVFIYSSGSVDAQKLVTKFSNHGSLSELIDGYFDTVTAGCKTERKSYDKICQNISLNGPSDVLFLSDNIKELRASLEAGLQSGLVERPGNQPLDLNEIQNLESLYPTLWRGLITKF